MSTTGNALTEYNPQMESFEYSQFEGESDGAGEVFSETDEMELAAQLLEVADEAELDQFLGDLIKKAGRAVGKVVHSPIGRAIGGALKSVAKKALPIAGGALGAWVGGPLGAKIGSGLAGMAGKALGLELEGLSQEDSEFEAAKQFVRFAGQSVKNAVSSPAATQNPMAVAKAAISEAARVHAPGLVSAAGGGGGVAAGGKSGRWVRRGNTIVVMGV
jgi:hypothetical protein